MGGQGLGGSSRLARTQRPKGAGTTPWSPSPREPSASLRPRQRRLRSHGGQQPHASPSGTRAPVPKPRSGDTDSPTQRRAHRKQTAPGNPAAPASRAPRTWSRVPCRPRPRPGPARPPALRAARHLPEVGGRGAQRGQQQRQREGHGQPARQQGPIQHLAAPRRLTIALLAPRRAPSGRRPLIAPGAPGRGRGRQLGPARSARGGITPAPGAGRNPSQTAAAPPAGPAGLGAHPALAEGRRARGGGTSGPAGGAGARRGPRERTRSQAAVEAEPGRSVGGPGGDRGEDGVGRALAGRRAA